MSRNSASVTPHSAGPRIGRSSSRFFSMRPSHLVIEGGQPPLLKITVWLGNKAADKYRLAPLFGRADVGKIPHGHRWDLPRSEFAPDSPLEEAVLSELVSEPKFPASWEYTRNFVRGSPPRPASGLNSGNNINALEGNSLRIRTGNLIRSNRELNRPIREIFTLIKESRAGPAISLRCNHFHNKRGYRKVQSSVTCPEGICSLADHDTRLLKVLSTALAIAAIMPPSRRS